MRLLPLLLFASLVLAGCATTARERTPPSLQVEVIVPPSSDMLREDDIADFFVDGVRETFRRRGFEGWIDELYFREEPRPGIPVLTVRLNQWRRTHTGGVECNFTASYRQPGGEEQPLGHFTSTELATTITSRWTLVEAFRATAERAAEDVWNKMAEANLLPGAAAHVAE